MPHRLADGDVLLVGSGAFAFVSRPIRPAGEAGESPAAWLSLARWRGLVDGGRAAELPPREPRS